MQPVLYDCHWTISFTYHDMQVLLKDPILYGIEGTLQNTIKISVRLPQLFDFQETSILIPLQGHC